MSDSSEKRIEKLVAWCRGNDSDASDKPPKPFEKLWSNLTIVCFALVILAVCSRSWWGWNIPGRLVASAFALVIVSMGLLAIYTGVAWLRIPCYRSKTPVAFWVLVSMYLLLGIFFFLGGIGVWGK